MTHHPAVADALRIGIAPDVHLVGCGYDKLDHAAPAAQLYCGDLTRKALSYCRTRGSCLEGPAACYIVSARYGLVDPETVIEPYDTRLEDLTPGELDDWRAMIVEQAHDLGLTGAHLWVHAGARYCAELTEALKDTDARVLPSLRGQMVGRRKQWYAGTLRYETERGFARAR